MDAHDQLVRQIADTVKDFYSRKEPFRIFHGSTSSTRPTHNKRVVDISALSNVLKIDTQSNTAIVEPNVSMEKLAKASLEHGLLPPVVMEFLGITVGGGYAGSAGESSSFKYGGFDRTVISVEIILATGEIVTASKSERSDLFKAAAGALGTLGIVSKLEVQLIKASKYVKTTYHRFSTVPESVSAIQKEIEVPSNDYVEGILYSQTHGAVITGQLTDDIPSSVKPQTFLKPSDPWFYLHAQKMSSRSPPLAVDYIPVMDYLFRYDRGAFWMGAHAFKYFWFVPFNRITRRILNRLMDTATLYRAGLGGGSRMTFMYVVHDLSLPYTTVTDFINWVSNTLDIWPLWLCPLPPIEAPTFHPHTSQPGGESAQPMLNVGVWGKSSKNLDTFHRLNRELETTLKDMSGRKVLYSHAYYPEEEFWEIYGKKWYDDLREKYSATTLPTVYDKVKVDVTQEREARTWRGRLAVSWPFGGLIGVWSALRH